MAISGLLVGAAALAAAQQGGQPAGKPYPALEILDAFSLACTDIGDIAKAGARVRAAGWEPIAADDKSQIAKIVDHYRQKVDAVGDFKPLEGSEYRKTVAGRELSLTLSGVEIPHLARTNFCRVYDFGAVAPVPLKMLARWAGREPDESEIQKDGFTKHVWETGLRPGTERMTGGMIFSFISPAVREQRDMLFSGLVFQAQESEVLE